MTMQGSLFDAHRPGDYRATDPMPSRKAAASNAVARASQKKDMLKRLTRGPASARGLADICGGQVSRASKRLGELRDAGLIRACGYEQTPKGRGGVPCTLYRLTEAGQRDVTAMLGASS